MVHPSATQMLFIKYTRIDIKIAVAANKLMMTLQDSVCLLRESFLSLLP